MGREVLHHRPMPWLKPAAFAGAAVVVLVVGAGLAGRSVHSRELAAWQAAQAIPTVAVTTPSAVVGVQNLVLPGQVQAFYDAPIHARVSGYLKAWYDDIGAHVKAGHVLAVIDTPDLDQQLEQAKADLATAEANQQLAKVTAQRWTSLLAQDAVSRQDTEDKTADLAAKTSLVKAAQANVDRLEALESFKRIVAPFDGVVTARTTDIGALINAGGADGVNNPGLFTVSDVHRLRVYVSVPQSFTAQIHPGQSVSLQVPEYPGRVFQATLTSTSGAIGDKSGALTAELQIDNPDGALKPGDYAQATFALPAAAGVLRVPASGLLFEHDGMNVAVVGPDGRVAMKPVTVARELGSAVEVSSGISPGDRVIVNPPDSIVGGEKVRVAPSQST